MSAVSARRAVGVELDDERNLISPDGVPLVEVVHETRPPIRFRRRKPPIIYCVVGKDKELQRIETRNRGSAEKIAAVVARLKDAEAVEIPVGEDGEPQLAEVAGEIRAIADLGVKVRIRLPE